MWPTDLRLQLHRNGYAPLPLIGKAPVLPKWTQTEIDAWQIALWSSMYPQATNTGALTRLMPTLDLDILNEEAANAAEGIVRAHHGPVLVRIGLPPKRAIPFRTDAPFKKITIDLIDGQKIEFLGHGQQVAVAGIHPDTGQPYQWHGGDLWHTPRNQLPLIHEPEARALINEITEMLCRDFGYRQGHDRLTTTQHLFYVSPVSIDRDRFVPKRLHDRIIELIPQRPKDQRRARGILRPLVSARENRNQQVYSAALQLRELIATCIIPRATAEKLLFLCAELNGYVAKRGVNHTWSTINSGLNVGHRGNVKGDSEESAHDDQS
jgi:hypothetical protein